MTTPARPTARAVAGMPVPPAGVMRAFVKARAWLGRAHARMVPPAYAVVERLTAIADAKLLAVAVELGIPDLLHAGPRRADELARAAGADPDALGRMLRFLASRDLLGVAKDGRYANTALSDWLRADHPWSFRDWALFFGADWHWDIWNRAGHAIRTGESATVAATGHPFFEYVNEVNPAAGRAYNGAMAAGSRLQGLLVLDAYDFAGVRRLCDVGGGTGAVLADVLLTYPALRGVLFDLPRLEAAARANLGRRGVADRAEFVGGDFFEAVPAGCDLYTLYAIVHDWDDPPCLTLLRNLARALPPGGRALVIESPVPTDAGPSLAKVFDLEMLLTSGGRERTERELRALFARAGLRVRRAIPLPSLFVIYELVPAPG